MHYKMFCVQNVVYGIYCSLICVRIRTVCLPHKRIHEKNPENKQKKKIGRWIFMVFVVFIVFIVLLLQA